MTPSGHLALAECKLWRNPEARRQALAQAMDYARAISGMSDADMGLAIRRSERHQDGDDLWSIASPYTELEEHEFRDAVRRNMRLGRLLLLIVGDGIREESEALAEFLQAHAGLHFSLAMVELALHRLPDGDDMLVQPRVLARTVNIERGIVRIADDHAMVEPAIHQASPGGKHPRSNLTVEEFYERLKACDAALPQRLQSFLDRVEPLGVTPDVRRSLIFRWYAPDGTGVNLGAVFPDKGEVWTDMIHHQGSLIGAEDLTRVYVEQLASATKGRLRKVSTTGRPWVANADGTPIRLSTLLDVEDQWVEAIQTLIERVTERVER